MQGPIVEGAFMMGEVFLSVRSLNPFLVRMPHDAHRIHAEFFDPSLEKDLGHHAFVLMAQQMAVEERNASDDRIGKVHHQIDISFEQGH
jgi:hypothetical protein